MISMNNAPVEKCTDGNSKQIKVVVSATVYDQFKKFCAESGQSMNKTLSKYIETVIQKKPLKTVPPLHMETRPQRRNSLKVLTSLIYELCEAESNYRDSTPENLRNGERYEQSEKSVDDMNTAIELLDDAC